MSGRWLSNSWAFLKELILIGYQVVYGAWMFARMRQPIVTVFGGAEAGVESERYAQAYALSKRLAQEHISVITGGGPGIMYAANCGARDGKPGNEKKENTLGIGVRGIDDSFENKCTLLLWVRSFFIRKWFLTRYSLGIVVFPGGLGTADELFNILNLRKHQRIVFLPIILIGVAYWQPIVDWLQEQALKEGYIKKEYLNFFVVTDSIDEAFDRIRRVCDQYRL